MGAEELRRQELTEALVGLVRTAGTGSFPRITDKDRVFFRGLAMSGKADASEEQLAAADVNNDEVADILDAAEIQKFAAGKITEFKKKA